MRATASSVSEPGWFAAFQELSREHGFEPLRVEGHLPEDLRGVLYRNGPAHFKVGNERYRHWFDGDGAVSAVRFERGGAFGAIRTVRTPERAEEQKRGRILFSGYGTV